MQAGRRNRPPCAITSAAPILRSSHACTSHTGFVAFPLPFVAPPANAHLAGASESRSPLEDTVAPSERSANGGRSADCKIASTCPLRLFLPPSPVLVCTRCLGCWTRRETLKTPVSAAASSDSTGEE